MAKLHPSTSENIKHTPTKHIIIHCKNLSGGHKKRHQPPHVFYFLALSWGHVCSLHSFFGSLPWHPSASSAPRRCGAKWGWPKPSDCRRRWRASNCPASPSRIFEDTTDASLLATWIPMLPAMDAMDMDGDVREMIWDDGIPCFKVLHGTNEWSWKVYSHFCLTYVSYQKWQLLIIFGLHALYYAAVETILCLALEAEAFGHTHGDRPKGRKVFPGCYRLYRSIIDIYRYLEIYIYIYTHNSTNDIYLLHMSTSPTLLSESSISPTWPGVTRFMELSASRESVIPPAQGVTDRHGSARLSKMSGAPMQRQLRQHNQNIVICCHFYYIIDIHRVSYDIVVTIVS